MEYRIKWLQYTLIKINAILKPLKKKKKNKDKKKKNQNKTKNQNQNQKASRLHST